MNESDSRFSRRSFLKNGTILSIGSVLLTDPVVQAMGKRYGINAQQASELCFTADILRHLDLLHLRYFFYNAKILNNYIVPIVREYPVFVYIQLPALCVGEEVIDKNSIKTRGDFKRTSSFLGGGSRLAFRMLGNQLSFDVEELLDWSTNFQMVTLDDFAVKKTKFRIGYPDMLRHMQQDFLTAANSQRGNMRTWHQNFQNSFDVLWPISKFEIPYKIFLSPIAPGAILIPGEQAPGNPEEASFIRKYGEHHFTGSNLIKTEYEDEDKMISIVRVWENKLMFKDVGNAYSEPSFKAITWDCQHIEDKDTHSELIPAPINREEINGLTMRPEFDRDIFSYAFRIGAYGATSHLKYRNDDPDSYSLVCFELITKYGRDNFASVSFRAVDTFTGLKLLISILTIRDYKFGVSFLPKLFYVSYAEKEKNYTSKEVLSRTPFIKIIADTDGHFFLPRLVDTTKLCYHVQMDKGTVNDPLKEDILLDFKYRGYDKSGTEHKFTSKIIFVPAENYEILSGTYEYKLRDQNGIRYPAGERVEIRHIGLLNPSYQEKYQNNPQANRCAVNEQKPEYIFRMNKTYGATQSAILKQDLDMAQKYVTTPERKSWFMIKIGGEITYARIGSLKQDLKKPRKSKTTTSLIPKDSSNASFNTNQIFFFCDVNTNSSYPANDRTLGDHPLLTKMLESDVVISQIDQLEGKSQYRTVAFADSYFTGNKEIDDVNESNKVKLLLRLVTPLEDFFAENYRSSGAMVKPEKKISHLSVLKTSLAYDESHNQLNASIISEDKDGNQMIKAASVFDSLKAEIFGIPLTAIIAETIGVDELPYFNYLQQLEESIDKIRAIANEYRGVTEEWLKNYEKVKNLVNTYSTQLADLEKIVDRLKLNPAKAWIEGLVGQYNSRFLTLAKMNSLVELEEKYSKYSNEVLLAVNKKIDEKLNGLNIKIELDKLSSIFKNSLEEKALGNLEELLIKISSQSEYPPAYFRESVKLYAINAIKSSPEFIGIFQSIGNMRDRLHSKYADYLKAFSEGYQESVVFCQNYLKERSKLLLNQIRQAEDNVTVILENAIKNVFPNFWQKIFPWIIAFNEIKSTYTCYADIYQDLKSEHYEKLATTLGVVTPFPIINDLEKELSDKLKVVIGRFGIPSGLDQSAISQLERLKRVFTEALSKDSHWLSNYDQLYEKYLREEVEKEWQIYLKRINALDEVYNEYVAKYKEISGLLKEAETQVQNFVHNLIGYVEGELEKKKAAIVNMIKGSAEYAAISNLIDQYNSLIAKISEFSKQKLEYNFRTDKFRKASLGGAIEFIPGNTVLKVNVAYEIEFDISLSSLPTIKRQSFYTDSKINDFKIGLMQLLYVDFESVRFVTGSDVRDDFNVNIRDVQFAGCLSFVQAMQEYLSTISDNFVFDIDSSGARIGYGFSIPDFSAGYFNFFNFNLSALLTLPFNPKESLQLRFGFGSPLNKFGITVSGIFGGQGYVNLIAEPRRGIVGMEIVLEFGAIFNLNLTVASGTAYLVGGIYIRKYNGIYQTKAYILCVGRFNVLGLFSASISFYLGLEGQGSVLYGTCTVRVSKRFTSFFEISVNCNMSKTLKGADDGNRQQIATRLVTEKDNVKMNEMGVFIQDSNLHQDLFFDDEIAYLSLWTKDKDAEIYVNKKDSRQNAYTLDKRKLKDKKYDGALHFFEIKPSKFASGESCDIEIRRADGTLLFSKKITAFKNPLKNCDNPDTQQFYVNDREYYASYYQ